MKREGRSPEIAFRDFTDTIFRIVEWSLLTAAVGAIGFWVDSTFLKAAATFLMGLLSLYIFRLIVSFLGGVPRHPLNVLVIGLLGLGLIMVASNFTRMVVLYGWQQQPQQHPKAEVPFRFSY